MKDNITRELLFSMVLSRVWDIPFSWEKKGIESMVWVSSKTYIEMLINLSIYS